MFIKRPLIPNKGLRNYCFQNINFPRMNKNINFPRMNLDKKYKEKFMPNLTGHLKPNNYLVSYDSLNDFENQIINNSLTSSDKWIFIPILCFLSLSSIMYYFYIPKK
jgi:hypothetical protein